MEVIKVVLCLWCGYVYACMMSGLWSRMGEHWSVCCMHEWPVGMRYEQLGDEAECGLGVCVYASAHSVWLVNERLRTHVLSICGGGDSLAGEQVKLSPTVRKH